MLLTLPNELLLQIASQSTPETVHSLCFTNRRLSVLFKEPLFAIIRSHRRAAAEKTRTTPTLGNSQASALDWAIKVADVALARTMISHHSIKPTAADLKNACNTSPKQCHVDMVELLLENEAPPEYVENHFYSSWPILRNAVLTSSPAIVALFLKHLARRNIIPAGGAMYTAAGVGDLGIIDQLLAAGCDPNGCEDRKGITALIRAVEKHNLPVVKKLVEAGADVNKTADYDYNALAAAVHANSVDIVRYLLEKEAAADVMVRGSWSARSIACEEVKEIMKEMGI